MVCPRRLSGSTQVISGVSRSAPKARFATIGFSAQLRHCRFWGIRWQLAAEQQAPLSQALNPEQSSVQLLPLQSRASAHELLPRQVMVLVLALLCTPLSHERGPEQLV